MPSSNVAVVLEQRWPEAGAEPRLLDVGTLRQLQHRLASETGNRTRLRLVAIAVLVDALMMALCGAMANLLLDRVTTDQAVIETLVLAGFYFPVAVAIRAYSRAAFARIRTAIQLTWASVLLAILAVCMAAFLTISA